MFVAGRVVALAIAFSCCVGAQLIGSKEWRQKNDHGNRFEGLGAKPIGNPFELVSFIGSLEPYTSASKLVVRFYLPDPVPPKVVAREIKQRKLYFMESKPGAARWQPSAWNEFSPWPVAEVLNQAVPADNLAVVVYLAPVPCSSCRVAPAWVYHTSQPKPPMTYAVWIRPNATMEKVEWHLYRTGGQREVEVDGDKTGPKQGGVPFPISLAGRYTDGPYRLFIQGYVAEDPDAKPILELSFWHQHQ